MSDDQAVQEAPIAAQNPQDLERELEKRIDKFRKLWLMLDSPNENERAVAIGRLHTMMGSINDITEKMTGERGTLNFAELLNKIESGGGANSEEVEEMRMMLDQFHQANELLKAAEDLLSHEVKRLRFLLKTRQYEEATIENPGKIVQSMLDKKDMLGKLCDDLKSFLDVPDEDWGDAYKRTFEKVQRERYDLQMNTYRGLRRNFLAWMLKKQGLPGSFEDLLEIQCLTQAQQRAIQQEKALVERITLLEDAIKSFDTAMNYVLHQTYSDSKTKEALKNIEQLELELERMEEIARERDEARMREGEIRKDLTAAQATISEREAAIEVMRRLVNDLKTAQRIADPTAEDETQGLNTNDLNDLRRACSAYASTAFAYAGGGKSHEDALREISVLREQIALLQDPDAPGNGGKSARFELVQRDHWKMLLAKNQELEDALKAFTVKYEEMLGGAKDWNDKMKRALAEQAQQLEDGTAKLKLDHAAAISSLKDAHKKALEEAEENWKKANKRIEDQLAGHLKNQASYRNSVQSSAAKDAMVKWFIAAAVGAAGGSAITSYYDTQPAAIVDQQSQQGQAGTHFQNDDATRALPRVTVQPN